MRVADARIAAILAWLARSIERVLTALGVVVAWITLPLLIGVSVYDIIGRRFYNTGSTRLQELEWHFFFALVVLSLGLTYLRNDHVRIDILRGRFSPRIRAWIELAGWIAAMLPFCAVVIYFGAQFAWRAYVSGEVATAALGVPYRWIIKSTLPIGAFVLFLAGLACACRNILFLMGQASAPAPSDAAVQSDRMNRR